MNVCSIVASGLLSLLWITLAIQDIRTHKLDNVGTLSAFALALGFRLGSSGGWQYGISLLACIVLALAVYSTGLIGGGDAKLLLSVLAWRPAMETGIVALVCLAVIAARFCSGHVSRNEVLHSAATRWAGPFARPG